MGRGSAAQKGQVAVLGAIVAVALILIVGLAVNAGISYVDQGSLQAGADTSATAGATMLEADFHACLTTGVLPYTSAEIAAVASEIAHRSVIAVAKVTSGPAVDYVTYTDPKLISVGSVAEYGGPLCLGPGEWTGPMGIRVTLGNSHQTPMLALGGIRSASESAMATAAFGVVQGGTYGPFVACAQQPVGAVGPVQMGDTVLLASPSWTRAESVCGSAAGAGFMGYLHDPSPTSITLPSASGIVSDSAGGDACGLWPSTIAVGDVVLVPLTNSVRFVGGRYQVSVEGLVAVRITRYSCPSAEGVVTSTAGSARGLLVCLGPTSPACVSAAGDVKTEATVVQLVS